MPPAWFSNWTGSAPAGSGSGSGTGTFGGPGSNSGGGSKWINMETNQIRNFASGELTGEQSEFSKWGFELTRRQRIIGFCAW